MIRPPYHRNHASSKRPGRKPSRARGNRPRRAGRNLGILLVLALGYSLLQYLTTGAVTWPGALLDRAADSTRDTVERTDTGWRQATEKLDRIGAARDAEPPPDFDFTGQVVRVSDGDTVSVLDKDNEQHKVRLYGIDTPERDQPRGRDAARALAKLVEGRTVGVVVVEKDDYGRIVGTVFHDDANVNLALVAAGHAWWYRYYAPQNRQLQAAEQDARDLGLGLWADPDPVPPWDWRRGRRQGK